METWSHGDGGIKHGDVDLRHGNMEKWRHGDMDMEKWTWRQNKNGKQKPRRMSLICLPVDHHANRSLLFVSSVC